jgi:SAM-dependent methyltransferase
LVVYSRFLALKTYNSVILDGRIDEKGYFRMNRKINLPWDAEKLGCYYADTNSGAKTEDSIRRAVQAIWKNGWISNRVFGYGFSAPAIAVQTEKDRGNCNTQTVFLAPKNLASDSFFSSNIVQGGGKAGEIIVVDENRWPLHAGSVNCLVVLHGLEHADKEESVLSEIRRVLSLEGKVIFIVPHRYSLWAYSRSAPFSSGRTYTVGCLVKLLTRNGFRVERHGFALNSFPQPLHGNESQGLARPKFYTNYFAGLVVAEASKEILSPLFDPLYFSITAGKHLNSLRYV